MAKKITESEFYMWRTLFAMSHADGVVTKEEIRFMVEALEDIPFTAEQKTILNDDIKNPKDIGQMFSKVTDVKDQAKFFKFARGMVYADGDFGKAEQEIMLKLKRAHIKNANVDKLIGAIDMELEDGPKPFAPDRKKPTTKEIFSSFREMFKK